MTMPGNRAAYGGRALAGRVALFENVNAGATPFLLTRLFNEYNRDEHVKTARKLAGLD